MWKKINYFCETTFVWGPFFLKLKFAKLLNEIWPNKFHWPYKTVFPVGYSSKRDWICSECFSKPIRIDQYDLYACKKCNKWLEYGCKDPLCIYCLNAPQTPENVDWNNEWNTK